MYIRRHISTSGNAQFVEECAQLKSIENSSLCEDNKLLNVGRNLTNVSLKNIRVFFAKSQ